MSSPGKDIEKITMQIYLFTIERLLLITGNLIIIILLWLLMSLC